MKEQSLPSHFQNVNELGKPIRTYDPSTFSRIGYVIGSVFLLVISLILLGAGLGLLPQMFPEGSINNDLLIISMGACSLILTIYWVWRLITRWNETLAVYEGGFAYFKGNKLDIFKWEEITSIAMRIIKKKVYGIIPAGTDRTYWIHKQTGEELKLDGSLSDPDDFINRVRQETYPYILARAKQLFEADEHIDFKSVSINRSGGMTKGKKNYPWSDIGQMVVNRGMLWVVPKEKGLFRKFSVPVTGMPNLDILVAISAEMAEKYK